MIARIAWLAVAFATLSACEQGEADRATSGANDLTAQTAEAPVDEADDAKAPTDEPAARAVSVDVENDLVTFHYGYPAEAAAIEALDRYLDAQRRQRFDELKADAAEWRDEAKAEGFPYNPYSLEENWAVVTNLPRFLSLSAEFYVFTGGAHGNTGFDALVWDRENRARIEPIAMFRSPAALADAIREPFCAGLDRERTKKRGAPVVRADDSFSDCIEPAEQTVILGSSDRRGFNRVGFLIGPYAAGPYAEGSYEVTLPVTQAVIDAVKPAYRDAFAIAGR